MVTPYVITDDGELYVTDSRYENTLDVVVQHMRACKFTDEEIMHMTHVTKEFIDDVCKPKKKFKTK